MITICGKAISAQTTVITNEKGEKITEVKVSSMGKGGYRESKLLYQGSILYNDGFEMATINIKGGQPVNAPILFNIYADELVAKVEDKEVLFKNTDFSIRGQHFISINHHYYELLFENDELKVLKRYHCVMQINRGHGGISMGGMYEGNFVRNEEFFFLFSNGKMKEFSINKLSVLSVLEKENVSLAYSFDNDTLRINKVEDVISLLKKK